MSNRIHSARPPHKQRGVIMIFVVIAMTSLIAMAGLALDFGVAFLTQSRIQNALDAAALSGAKSLKVSAGNTTQATTDARAAFTYYVSQLGLLSNASATTMVPDVQFSSSLVPFTPGSTPANFIRVLIPNGYSIPTYLTRVVPSVGNTLSMGGTAVAGPVRVTPGSEACGLIPIVVSVGAGTDKGANCSDNNECFGYKIGEIVPLKAGKSSLTAGSGNFNLLTLGNNGANALAANLAGGYNKCVDLTTPIDAKTGNTVGPFHALDTRFGVNKTQTITPAEEPNYPPDIYTGTDVDYAGYQNKISNLTPTNGAVPGRRLVSVVFSTFDPPVNGGSGPVPVAGVGCFFLLAPSYKDKDTKDQQIDAEFVRDCNIGDGNLSDAGLEDDDEFYKIVLYKDPDGRAS